MVSRSKFVDGSGLDTKSAQAADKFLDGLQAILYITMIPEASWAAMRDNDAGLQVSIQNLTASAPNGDPEPDRCCKVVEVVRIVRIMDEFSMPHSHVNTD